MPLAFFFSSTGFVYIVCKARAFRRNKQTQKIHPEFGYKTFRCAHKENEHRSKTLWQTRVYYNGATFGFAKENYSKRKEKQLFVILLNWWCCCWTPFPFPLTGLCLCVLRFFSAIIHLLLVHSPNFCQCYCYWDSAQNIKWRANVAAMKFICTATIEIFSTLALKTQTLKNQTERK